MIDTIKIYTAIDEKIYNKIRLKSDIKTSYNVEKQQCYYNIVSGPLEGSFDTNLHYNIDDGSKYGFRFSRTLVIEGSFHKYIKGQNSYDGFYNLQNIVLNIINIFNNKFGISLPGLNHWFINRVDITKCFDVVSQSNVFKYINSFRYLNYPRRNLKFYENECVYITGQTTTLKIYNKLLEFINHDKKKVKNFLNFDINSYQERIFGFVRFECEIKKRKLKDIYNNKKFIRVNSVFYSELEKVWCDEFMKLLKFDYSGLKQVREKDEVMRRLFSIYKPSKANVLYSFYLNILIDGYQKVKKFTSNSTFYRNIKELKSCGVDISQSANLVYDYDEKINFNPFECLEVI